MGTHLGMPNVGSKLYAISHLGEEFFMRCLLPLSRQAAAAPWGHPPTF